MLVYRSTKKARETEKIFDCRVNAGAMQQYCDVWRLWEKSLLVSLSYLEKFLQANFLHVPNRRSEKSL